MAGKKLAICKELGYDEFTPLAEVLQKAQKHLELAAEGTMLEQANAVMQDMGLSLKQEPICCIP